MTEPAAIETDIVIIGAGPVGLTLALALARGDGSAAAPQLLLLDGKARGSYVDDPRALALSHGTRQLLETLGAWNAAAGTAINDIHISQAGGFGRAVITREEMQADALGHVMRYRDLAAALDREIAADAVLDRCQPYSVQVEKDTATVHVRRDNAAQTIRCRLVVHAEGTPTDDAAEVCIADYRQHAVVAEVRPQQAHGHRAWERFTPDGPLALLPLGDDYALVFTVPPAKAEALMAMDDAAFLDALQAQFGTRHRFTAASPRARFPLALRLRRAIARPREVWIGNAAQTLHPVSGQGFNLGIRDAWALADTLLTHGREDPGSAALLARHARHRQLDRHGSAVFTDGIVRAFSNDVAPLRVARGIGLAALDLCPIARRFVAARMIWGARAW